MTKLLILGANGKIARYVDRFAIADASLEVTLFLRNKARIDDLVKPGVKVIEGDVTNQSQLQEAMKDQDVVYANLAGDNIKDQAEAVVKAMENAQVKRLIWISTLGIYDEVPGNFGKWNNEVLGSYLTRYRAAADVIEVSDLDYTVIRPAWLTDKDEVDYELTAKGEPFKGTEVSRKSIGAYVYHLIINPTENIRESVGVNKPNTDGDKPAWY